MFFVKRKGLPSRAGRRGYRETSQTGPGDHGKKKNLPNEEGRSPVPILQEKGKAYHLIEERIRFFSRRRRGFNKSCPVPSHSEGNEQGEGAGENECSPSPPKGIVPTRRAATVQEKGRDSDMAWPR